MALNKDSMKRLIVVNWNLIDFEVDFQIGENIKLNLPSLILCQPVLKDMLWFDMAGLIPVITMPMLSLV